MTRKTAILLLLLAGLYLSAVNDHWAPKSDSALYVGLGRSLAEGRGMVFNGRQEWGIPPVLPFLLAGCRLLVGDHYWLPNLCMTVCGLGVVVFSTLSVRRLSADLPASVRGTVVLGTLLVVGTSARLFIDTTRLMTDVPCLLFVTAGLYAFLRARSGHWAWYLVGTAVMVVAILTRLLAVFFFAGYGVAAALTAWQRGRKSVLVALVGGTLAAAGLFLLWILLFRNRAGPEAVDYLSAKVIGRLSPLMPGKGAELLNALARLPDAVTSTIVYQKLSWFGLVPLALMAIGLVRAVRLRQWFAVFPVGFYVGFLVWWAPGSVASRYLLLAMPMLVYLLLAGLATAAPPVRKVLARAARRLRGSGRRTLACWAATTTVRAGRLAAIYAVSIAVAIAMAISLPKIGREIYWMRHSQFYTVFDGGRWQDYKAMADDLRNHADPSADRCLTPKGTVVHYWSGVICRSQIRWKETRYSHLHDLPPNEFARMAARSRYTFIAAPMDEGEWSRAIVPAMEQVGAFEAPPRRFGDLALFERNTEAGSPCNGEWPRGQSAGSWSGTGRPTGGEGAAMLRFRCRFISISNHMANRPNWVLLMAVSAHTRALISGITPVVIQT